MDYSIEDKSVITAFEAKGKFAVLTFDPEAGTTGYQVVEKQGFAKPYEKGGFKNWLDAKADFDQWAESKKDLVTNHGKA